MSSWLIAPIGGVLHLSSARACASAASSAWIRTFGKDPAADLGLVEHILSKQLFMKVSHQDKSSETVEDILMHLLDGGFSSAAHFRLQASGTYLTDFHPRAFALIDLETYHSAYMGKRHLKEELEAQIADSPPLFI